MPDVSLYVAAITAGAAVFGAGVSLLPVYLRDVRQAGQDRRDRHADSRRQACLDLLGAAEDLRTTVANAADYHGAEMPALLGRVMSINSLISLAALAIGPLFGAIVLRLHGPHDAVVALLFLVGLLCVAAPVWPGREVLCHPAEYIAQSLHHRVAAWSHDRR